MLLDNICVELDLHSHLIDDQNDVKPLLSIRHVLLQDLFYLTDRLELIRQGITTANHGGLDLEPPVIHPLAGVKWHNRQRDLVKGLCDFSIQ